MRRWLKGVARALFLSRPAVSLWARLHTYRTTLAEHRLKRSLKGCGERVALQLPLHIAQPEEVELGDDVSIAAFVHIWGAGGVRVGARTMIGSHSAISSVTHDYESAEMWCTVVTKPVSIGSDVWLGAHCMILPGVTVGEGAVVGAGSVVTRDVEPMTVVAGVPAREISRRPRKS
jgi:acetyltransferase-like isoleucine patch superfamily enzyme